MIYTPNKTQNTFLELAHTNNIPLLSHDDATPEHVKEALAHGVVITEFPTTLSAAQAANKAGIKVLMGGPNLVLGSSHTGNISALELARNNYLDIISSDYVPHSLLHAAFLLPNIVENFNLSNAIRTITKTPAHCTGLDDRGVIDIGKRADIIRVCSKGPIPIVRAVWKMGERML